VLSVCLVGWSASPGHAQVTPTSPAPQTPPPQPAPKPAPNDAPSVRVGGTLFLDYTYTESPDITDADGNRVNSSAFNVGRGYINITGQVNHLVAFRITPDISRETGAGSSLNGSLTYRLKYAYGQFNLDDWMWQGTWVRLGMQPTPVVNFEEDVYRYRFQGPTFADREGYLSSSDFGVAFRTLFPKDRGELMTGFYNGETYSQAETNDQKAFQVRGTVRPFVGSGPERGLRLTVFYDADHYVQDAERRRLETIVSFEHKYVNAAWVFLDAADRTSIGVDDVDGQGHSLWVTPRSTFGLEGLLRYDRLAPDHRNESLKERWIAGVAYWPKVSVATVSSAIMLDYEYVHYARFAPARPTERRVFVHMLVSF
jgi:hypothetical protein